MPVHTLGQPTPEEGAWAPPGLGFGRCLLTMQLHRCHESSGGHFYYQVPLCLFKSKQRGSPGTMTPPSLSGCSGMRPRSWLSPLQPRRHSGVQPPVLHSDPVLSSQRSSCSASQYCHPRSFRQGGHTFTIHCLALTSYINERL